ncbi:MAG: hypothetical protein QM483_06330 [Desulfuromusa sp.]
MKKFIIYVVFVFVTGFSAYFGYWAYLAAQYDDTAVPYIQKVLPELSTWNPDIVKQYMAPEVLRTVTAEELEGLMGALAKIGSLQSIGKLSFKNKSTLDDVQLANHLLITYEVEALYSTGDAKITISLLGRDGSYDLYSFNFQSEALAP